MTAPDLLRFGGGLPDPEFVPPIADLLEEVVCGDSSVFQYPEGDEREWGNEPLRDAVATRMTARSGTALGVENIVLTNGAGGAIDMAALDVITPGTVVAVEELTYPAAVRSFRQRGASIVTVPVDHDGLRVDVLEELVQRADPGPTVIYTIATAQSPTGTVLTPERRQYLAALVDRSGLTILQDDTYGELVFEGDEPQPLIGLAPERTIHVGSFSKTLAPGLRLGWIAAPTPVCAAIAAARTDLGTAPLVQWALARFFADGRWEPHLRKATDFYRMKRDVLLDGLEQHCSDLLTWTTPRAGLFVWALLTTATLVDVERCGAEVGVAVLDEAYFSVDPPHRNGMRLAFGELSADQLAEGTRRLGEAIRRAAA